MWNDFKGLVTPIITTFDQDGNFHRDNYVRYIEYLAQKGIKNLFLVGSYGSFPMLDQSERKEVAKVGVETSQRLGLKTIVQIGSTSTKVAVQLAKHAESIGADAVASVVPFYYSGVGYSDKAYLKHYETLVKEVKIPVHFYNNPKTTGYTLTSAVFEKLIDVGVRGVKHTGDVIALGDMLNIIKKKRVSFNLMPGSGAILMTGTMMGCQACVVGTSNAFPELCHALYEAVIKGDFHKAGILQLKVMKAREIQGRYSLRAAACYDLLKMRGLDVGQPRAPWASWDEKQMAECKNELIAEELFPFDIY